MKPFSSVQPLCVYNKETNKYDLAGCCFRVWSDNHFLTASHCISNREDADIRIYDYIQDKFLNCDNIIRHPRSDLSVIETRETISSEFEKFTLTKCISTFGENVHCFGTHEDLIERNYESDVPGRVIGGIIQRHYVHIDNNYISPALEYSSPIPKGMSGGPAFNAKHNNIVVGIAIGTIKSSTVVSEIAEYEDEILKEKEKISEIIRYGVLLRLFDFTDWLEDVIPNKAS